MAATEPRLTVISGAFGTGKTEIAINLALELRAQGHGPVTLVDLDIVNLYFRSRQKAYELEQLGIRVISSVEGMENADLPALSPEINACFDRKDGPVVFDLGGSDLGGLVAAYLHRGFAAEPSRHWLVVNPYRPFNQTAEATVDMAQRIEARSRLPITGHDCEPAPHRGDDAGDHPGGIREGARGEAVPAGVPGGDGGLLHPGAFDDLGVPVMVIRKQMKQPWEPGGIMMAGKKGKDDAHDRDQRGQVQGVLAVRPRLSHTRHRDGEAPEREGVLPGRLHGRQVHGLQGVRADLPGYLHRDLQVGRGWARPRQGVALI